MKRITGRIKDCMKKRRIKRLLKQIKRLQQDSKDRTMTELKRICPFCGGEMIGSNGHPICHYNPDCVIHDESVPQELLDLLAYTKKKLDEAIDLLKMLYGDYNLDWSVVDSDKVYDFLK